MERIEQLTIEKNLSDSDLKALIEQDVFTTPLALAADKVRRQVYGDEVYIRGLIELTNYCKNNCYYCGIRRDNREVARYRLDEDEVLACCRGGHALGFRTFVLQGGEDPYYTDEKMCRMVSKIRETFPDCAITLSLGEKSKDSYRALYEAGANRYLLRHETANACHYSKLHPKELTFENRKQCLYHLKEIGFQVGAGFMVGSPFQTIGNLVEDLRFLQELDPDMIGIGPFLPHHATPFATEKKGDLHTVLRLLSILRLMFPHALLPSTTALGTLHPDGRKLGLQAGGNVVMPNLSPQSVRKLYALYEDKISTDEEAAEGLEALKWQVSQAGYRVVTHRGDVKRN
jgi:biotin synthase